MRQAVYKKLPVLDFTVQVIVAGKTAKVITKFNNNPNALYDQFIKIAPKMFSLSLSQQKIMAPIGHQMARKQNNPENTKPAQTCAGSSF